MLQKLATLLGVPPYQFPRPSYIAGNIATKQKCISSRLHIQTSVKHSGKSAFALSGNSVNACLWNIMKHTCCPSLCLTVLWGSPLSLCGYRLFFSSENLRCEFLLWASCSNLVWYLFWSRGSVTTSSWAIYLYFVLKISWNDQNRRRVPVYLTNTSSGFSLAVRTRPLNPEWQSWD